MTHDLSINLRRDHRWRPLRWFTHVGPPRGDGAGRIWVLGQHADSAFADVFAGSRFLGRLPLPCRDFQGRWSLNGSWLAVVCAPDDLEADRDADLKLFRIVEP